MNSLLFRSIRRKPVKLVTFICIKLMLITAVPLSVYAEQPMRVISTDAGVTELMFALGLDKQLIAVDVTSQLPPDYPKLANIGYHRTLSAEGLLSLNPTVVIGSEHTGPENVLMALKQANVKFVPLNSAKTGQQLEDNILQLSAALNQTDKGQALLASVNGKLAKIEQHHLAGERVAFLLAMDETKLRLAGRGTSGDAFIQLMKAENVAGFDNYRNISAESLLEMQPTIIIVAGRTADTAVPKLLAANAVLAHTPAGKQQRIVAVDGASLVVGLSVSAIDEAIRLTQQLSTIRTLAVQGDH
ncbi:ABC transporter substrate-binding protein [Amphritea sp. 2_MG-2023]|uniref:heme/hemin ABC transporter substrate-binding protein n=1 Tax=Amphritea TaxID=515417 RepID=UPI001C07B8DF|nr:MULTISPECIES: ABC transporter substrate-binding protein [Amphritea]MBU2964263.1 ABC transporter substrate-binding protein [Amphritea atlantica]MDO6419479.1 ABC transporter substrate-binding protein [Amphritea sp. 2_MG-2023]